jgi:CHRD domain
MKKLLIPFVFGLVFLAVPGLARADFYFFVSMSGAGEVPPNEEQGFGEALVIISDDFTTITVSSYFDDLTGPATASHIHIGPPDGTGPVVLPFAGFPADTDGHYEADLTPDDISPTSGFSYRDLVRALFQGNAYMNIHTAAHPGGEIRGQVSYIGQ